MEIIINREGSNTLYVQAAGRLDLDNATILGTKVKHSVEDFGSDIKELILDFSKITFLSSFGLKIILELYKFMKLQNGVLKIKGVSGEIMNSFKIIGFDKFLEFI